MGKDSKAIQKLLAMKARTQNRSYVKDEDLQIQIPPSEGSNAENMMAFKNIYTHYMQETGGSSMGSKSKPAKLTAEVQLEMEEAEESYNTMMELRKSIADAYHNFVKK